MGLTWHRGSFYFRKRVPQVLRTAIGKRELWRSLDTKGVRTARRRLLVVAAKVEAEFEMARVSIGLPVDEALIWPCDDGLGRSTVADRLVERLAAVVHPHEPASGKSIGAVYDLYFADPRHAWSKRTVGSYATTRRWVLDVFGANTPIGDITREQCREFLNLLLRMPAHADKRYRGLSLREAVAAADGKNARIITAANVNAHLIRFGATMNWALDEGHIERNPSRGLRIPDPVARRDKRHPFSSCQLRAIFAAPIFTGCEDDWYGYAKPGGELPRRARFWVPLIALFSGMRLNEICQLDTADIVVVEEVTCFSVTAVSRSSTAKRVKTAASNRLVPLHPELQQIGLPSYVAERRRAGDLKLFPELPVSAQGYHSVAFSRWFTRFLEASAAAAEKTCFHSFRHNFRDALREANVPREIALLLGGWSSSIGASGIADTYGSGFKSGQLAEEVAKVRYRLLDLSHLHLPAGSHGDPARRSPDPDLLSVSNG